MRELCPLRRFLPVFPRRSLHPLYNYKHESFYINSYRIITKYKAIKKSPFSFLTGNFFKPPAVNLAKTVCCSSRRGRAELGGGGGSVAGPPCPPSDLAPAPGTISSCPLPLGGGSNQWSAFRAHPQLHLGNWGASLFSSCPERERSSGITRATRPCLTSAAWLKRPGVLGLHLSFPVPQATFPLTTDGSCPVCTPRTRDWVPSRISADSPIRWIPERVSGRWGQGGLNLLSFLGSNRVASVELAYARAWGCFCNSHVGTITSEKILTQPAVQGWKRHESCVLPAAGPRDPFQAARKPGPVQSHAGRDEDHRDGSLFCPSHPPASAGWDTALPPAATGQQAEKLSQG